MVPSGSPGVEHFFFSVSQPVKVGVVSVFVSLRILPVLVSPLQTTFSFFFGFQRCFGKFLDRCRVRHAGRATFDPFIFGGRSDGFGAAGVGEARATRDAFFDAGPVVGGRRCQGARRGDCSRRKRSDEAEPHDPHAFHM